MGFGVPCRVTLTTASCGVWKSGGGGGAAPGPGPTVVGTGSHKTWGNGQHGRTGYQQPNQPHSTGQIVLHWGDTAPWHRFHEGCPFSACTYTHFALFFKINISVNYVFGNSTSEYYLGGLESLLPDDSWKMHSSSGFYRPVSDLPKPYSLLHKTINELLGYCFLALQLTYNLFVCTNVLHSKHSHASVSEIFVNLQKRIANCLM